MGEYATYNGIEIKIGTCENMYYLRADQVHQVKAKSGNVNPASKRDQEFIRFRFPWPDEDKIQPGGFNDFDKSLAVSGVELPVEVEHDTVQFSARAGYVCSLPCPESNAKIDGITVHRNGFAGKVHIVQQAYRNGLLVTICKCGGCGALYRLDTLRDAQPIIAALRERAEKESPHFGMIADRIEAGYTVTEVVAV